MDFKIDLQYDIDYEFYDIDIWVIIYCAVQIHIPVCYYLVEILTKDERWDGRVKKQKIDRQMSGGKYKTKETHDFNYQLLFNAFWFWY